ncbi:DNA-processing protein DprA [Peptococcaceae bacterium]|nr:DNA-processing protein DprA [Peptococcaceae bacterium]
MRDRIYWLGWQLIFAGSPNHFWNIINYFGSAEDAWNARREDLLEVENITQHIADKIIAIRKTIDLDGEAECIYKHGVDFITYDDVCYPYLLKQIFDPPPVIFVKGNINSFKDNAVAIVGSRNPTAYGITAAKRIAFELAEHDVCVVSGMARGIDAAAHSGALESKNGSTVAVLGCGVDIAYPRENACIMEEIVQKGAVISEFPLGTPPKAWRFPVRNRIISGLSKIVLIVEAGDKSGALITADIALEQGRDVMAVPGNIYSKMSKGPLKLIKQGAKPVTETADILEELGIESLFAGIDDNVQTAGNLKLSELEQKILKVLSEQPCYVEDLFEAVQAPSQEILAAITFLEVKGIIKRSRGQMYSTTFK